MRGGVAKIQRHTEIMRMLTNHDDVIGIKER